MNMKKLKREFIEQNKEFIEENSNDKILINYEWLTYVDELVKDGIVTQKQWQNLENIFE